MRSKSYLFFDFMVFILLLFPLLTGGIWIDRPGLFIELSDLAIPTLLITLIGAVVFRKGDPLRDSLVFRYSSQLWNQWESWVSRRSRLALLSGALFFGTIWSLAAVLRHWNFGTHFNDFGIYLNGLWNFTSGHGYLCAPCGDVLLMVDHQSPSFLVLAPLLKIFPYAETLLIVQSMGLALGGMAMYYLFRQYSSIGWGASLAPLIYWAYLPIRNASYFNFHPEAIALSFLLCAIVGLQSTRSRDRILGMMAMIFAMGLKEAIPTVTFAIGMVWLLGAGPLETRKFTRKLALPLMIGSFSLFYLDLHWVPKLYGFQNHHHQNEYSHFGNCIKDIILSPFLKPGIFLDHIFTKSRLIFLFWTLAPLAFLPLLNPLILITALPGYLLLFLSSAEYRINIQFHYSIIPAVGLFWAMPMGFNRLQKWSSKKFLVFWIIFWVLGTHGRSDGFKLRSHINSSHAKWIHSEVIPNVNPNTELSTSAALLPHFARRRYINVLPNIRDAQGQLNSCIFWDSAVQNLDLDEKGYQQFRQSLLALGYKKVVDCDGFEAYELKSDRNDSVGSCFQKIPICTGLRR